MDEINCITLTKILIEPGDVQYFLAAHQHFPFYMTWKLKCDPSCISPTPPRWQPRRDTLADIHPPQVEI